MIRFRVNGKDGRVLIGLGLSEENIKRMKAGQPINFSLEDMGYEGLEMIIVTGETEDKIVEDMKKQGFKGL